MYKSKTADWQKNTNIYEVNLRQYTSEGSFTAFAKELPRLQKMGVATLWFMPITPISSKEMKGTMGSYYACSDYESINSEFGTIADFKKLVTKAHNLGMKVIIDWVANHTGWQHTWTLSNPDYYKWDDATNNFMMASGMEDIIELNYNNSALRAAMIQAMAFWLQECDIDGFRCDLASWVQLDFWQEARPQLEKIKPIYLLGEFDELDSPGYGEVFDTSYSWKWMHATKEFYDHKIGFDHLRWLLSQYENLGVQSNRAWFTTNHDENSWNGTEFEKYGPMALTLAAFSFTWPGIPLLYSGQELPNHKRLAFFDKDVIEWKPQLELENFYKTLISLKTHNQALLTGETNNLPYLMYDSNYNDVLIYHRKCDTQEVLVLLNFSAQANVQIHLQHERLQGLFTNIFDGGIIDFNNSITLPLQEWGYLIFEKK